MRTLFYMACFFGTIGAIFWFTDEPHPGADWLGQCTNRFPPLEQRQCVVILQTAQSISEGRSTLNDAFFFCAAIAESSSEARRCEVALQSALQVMHGN